MAPLATKDHDPPSQCSVTLFRFSPFPSVPNPTAQQFDVDVQLTLWRRAPTSPSGVGLGTIDHESPSQCSVSEPVGDPSPATPRTAPTAQQSDPLMQVTSKRPPPLAAGIAGLGVSVHDVPFQCSTRGVNVEFELILLIVTPTAQHEKLLAQAEPRTMSSAVGLLLGAVTIFHPEAEASLGS